jgi:hypothetical protein
VKSVSVSFKEKKATVTMTGAATLTKVDCDNAFRKTKYSVIAFEQTVSAKPPAPPPAPAPESRPRPASRPLTSRTP